MKGRRALYTTSRFDEISASGYKLNANSSPLKKT
jgi:hypothetical protein